MAYGNEADELRALGRILEKGYVFRGLKPVNWCFDCGSALAEAEVEYADRKDPAIDVAFPFTDRAALAQAFGVPEVEAGAAVIWTTTPWTIPANQALNINAELNYALVRVTPAPATGPLLLVAAERVNECLRHWGHASDIVATCKGEALAGLHFAHPLAASDDGYARTAPVYLADYVSLEAGTGIVHSAPAYGIEDFNSCRAHGVPDDKIINPVLGDGRYASTLPLFGGLTIWEANPKIVQALNAAGRLIKVEQHTHSYMHCWRHKTPVIYRATNQWFAGMDVQPTDGAPSLRESALAGIDQTAFYPAWGRARLRTMIANRPDWTLSRQRQWGVPMAFFVHKETGELHPNTPALIEQVARRIEQEGIEAWQKLDPRELLGKDAEFYEKNRDTLDVWFDSGTTHATVLGGRRNATGTASGGSHGAALAWPADLYLEGSDQHRGWFHSSLLTGCMLFGRPPYKALLTHGFVVDGQGRKMSKSVGNVIAPQKVSDSLGAEILRLWVAATDYSGELSISDEILKRVVESYRRIRNTLRFLLANVADFDAATQSVPDASLLEIDRYALLMTARVQDEIRAYYERYDFHPAVARLQSFCSEDLGAFYLDILKDRLYTSAPNSLARRSAQTALTRVARTLVKLMAPILSFTAEEAWKILDAGAAGGLDHTVFTSVYETLNVPVDGATLLARWDRLRTLRAEVMRRLEDVRADGKIGASLQAEVVLHASGADYAALHTLGDELKFVLIVSQAQAVAGEGELRVDIKPTDQPKCARCWHWRTDVGTDAGHPEICARCVNNLFGSGEPRSKA
jgi:isoleucyl-tRNA synthetase